MRLAIMLVVACAATAYAAQDEKPATIRPVQFLSGLMDLIPAKMMATPADKETDVHRAERADWMNKNLVGKNLRLEGFLANMHPKGGDIVVQMTAGQSVGKRDYAGHIYVAVAPEHRSKLEKAKVSDRLEVVGEIIKISMIRTRSGNRDFISLNLELRDGRVVNLRPGKK